MKDTDKNFNEIKKLSNMVYKLKKDSHPPVNWKELIQANSSRIDSIEDKMSRGGVGMGGVRMFLSSPLFQRAWIVLFKSLFIFSIIILLSLSCWALLLWAILG